MRRGNVFFGILTIFLAITMISANSYSAEFIQVNDKIVVKEILDGKYLGSYVDSNLLDKSGNSLYFVKKIKFNQSFSEVNIKLNLDKGIIIQDGLIFPAGYDVETDGQTISIIWNLKNIISGQDFAMFVTLEDTSVSFSWIYWVIGIIVIVILGIFVYWLEKKGKLKFGKTTRKASSKKKKTLKNSYDYLLDTEKRVIEELKKADRHELWQKQIQNATGFSKAKVSRLVRNLEARGLIVKIPFGNTNKVRLK